MSDAHDAQRSAAPLDGLLREARAESPPDVDWARVDAELFERVNREASHVRALADHRGRPSGWMGLAVLAAASVAAVAIPPASKVHAPESPSATESAGVLGSAGDLTLQQGSGEVRLDGSKARTGARVQGGVTIETHGARALFEWGERVSWLLENESKVRAERTNGSPLVLALADGAVEAQVMPVSSGEAFAVDVEGVRVAVHGTHLRVARDGDRVVVDLSEGTVSIGAPPKIGSTYGTLVTAPAHVEFHASALATSISIDHDVTSVRTVADLSSVPEEGASTNVNPRSFARGAPARGETGSTPSAPQGWISKPLTRSPLAAAAAPNPLADEVVASAVRACATGNPHSTDLTITVSSTLTVDVHDDGFARLANFDPPLAPDIQACASHTIYSTRFVSPGLHKIAIAIER